MYEINRAKHLPQALVHFVMARASLFTDHKITGLQNRALVQAFEDNLSAYFWHIL